MVLVVILQLVFLWSDLRMTAKLTCHPEIAYLPHKLKGDAFVVIPQPAGRGETSG
jgi:hypothetical protein